MFPPPPQFLGGKLMDIRCPLHTLQIFLCVLYEILGSQNIVLGFTTHISMGHLSRCEMKCHNSFGGDSAKESILTSIPGPERSI
jgi:hypothetical protein